MTIEYRTLEQYPGYRIGNDGSVWSCLKDVDGARIAGRRYELTSEWKQLKPEILKRGNRARYALTHESGLRDRIFGARLVLLAFVGPCPDGMEACHENGDCTNDALYNVRWDTPESNKEDLIKHGVVIGGQSKLTEQDKLDIIEMRSCGESVADLASDFDVDETTIRRVIKQHETNNV